MISHLNIKNKPTTVDISNKKQTVATARTMIKPVLPHMHITGRKLYACLTRASSLT